MVVDLSGVDFCCCCGIGFFGRENQLVSQRAAFCLQPIVVQRTLTRVGRDVIGASFEPHRGTALTKNVDDEVLAYRMLPAHTRKSIS